MSATVVDRISSETADVDDAALVTAARHGDAAAFGELYRRWRRPLGSVIFGVLRNPADVDEVVHDSFLQAWRCLGDLREPAVFGAWLLRVGRNRALNRSRHEVRSRCMDHEALSVLHDARASESGSLDPVASVIAGADAALLWSAAAGLAERDRELMCLHVRRGLGLAEIADELAISANHVSQLMHRLRSRLRAAMCAHALWRQGEPVCADLDSMLRRRRITCYDERTVRAIGRHARTCTACSTRATQAVDRLG